MDKPLKDCGSNDAAGDAAGDICNDTAGDSYNGSDDYDDMCIDDLTDWFWIDGWGVNVRAPKRRICGWWW